MPGDAIPLSAPRSPDRAVAADRTAGQRHRRIAVVTTSFPSGDGDPSGHFVAAEVDELQREGATVSVVRPEAGGAFGWPGAASRLRSQPWRIVEASRWALRASRQLDAAGPLDRIVAHWSVPAAFPVVTMSRTRGVPLEVVSHGGDVRLLCGMPSRARSFLVETIARRATTWRFVSTALMNDLVEAVEPRVRPRVLDIAVVSPGRLGTIAVDPAMVRARRAGLGDRPLYVCAARLVPSKRVDRVIDYVASTPRAPAPVLVILGDGPSRAQLEEQAHRWRMDARFLGTMSRPETLTWIGAADEVVHASRAEGLSTVLREAEQLGVKVTRL